jgi:hypothetical protein
MLPVPSPQQQQKYMILLCELFIKIFKAPDNIPKRNVEC